MYNLRYFSSFNFGISITLPTFTPSNSMVHIVCEFTDMGFDQTSYTVTTRTTEPRYLSTDAGSKGFDSTDVK